MIMLTRDCNSTS